MMVKDMHILGKVYFKVVLKAYISEVKGISDIYLNAKVSQLLLK